MYLSLLKTASPIFSVPLSPSTIFSPGATLSKDVLFVTEFEKELFINVWFETEFWPVSLEVCFGLLELSVEDLTAKALTGQNSLDFSDKDTLNSVNAILKEFLTSKMKDFLYKTSRDYGCDINGFYKLVKQKFLTIPEYNNYNWGEMYKKADFNVEIDSNVISSFSV